MYCNTIWLELASLLVGSEYSTSSFYLPSIQTPKLFPNQTVLLLDDTTDKTTVILKDGENLLSTNISAMLYMDSDEKGAKKHHHPVRMVNVEI